MREVKLITLVFVAVTALTLPAKAAVIAYNPPAAALGIPNSYVYDRGDGPYMIGNLIEVGASVQTLGALGLQDTNNADATAYPGTPEVSGAGLVAADGFIGGSVDVGLWDATGNLLASVFVLSTDPQPDPTSGYRYHAITPITLAANTQYYIGAEVGNGIEGFLDTETANIAYTGETGFTLLDSTYSTDVGDFAAPTTTGQIDGRWGPANALLASVPEPASLGLLALAAAGTLLRRRKV